MCMYILYTYICVCIEYTYTYTFYYSIMAEFGGEIRKHKL